MGAAEAMPWSRDEFEQKLRAKGKRYHIYHPYQVAMNSGKLTKEQIQGWVYNRYYYQISIPIKDAAVLSNMPDRDHRRQWIQRIIDHDGTQGDEGGIEAWIWLGQACGLQREDITSLKHVLPGVRFAVDAYVNFARRAPWQEAVCSSLDRTICPGDPQGAAGQLAAALPVDRPVRLRLLPQALVRGAARRRARLARDLGLLLDPRATAACARDPAVQAGHSVVHAGRHADCLRSRPRASGRRRRDAR